MSRRNRVVAALALVLGVLALQTTAFAGSGTITPDHVTTDGQLVHITWSGMSANQSVWIQVCNGDTGLNYNQSVDCSFLSSQERNSSFNTTGSGATGSTGSGGLNPEFPILVGDAEGGDLGWGCRSDGTPTGTTIGAIKYYNPCRVRVTDGSLNVTTNEFFLNYTIDTVGTPVPEAHLAIVLPIGAALVLAGAFFIVRRRERPTAA